MRRILPVGLLIFTLGCGTTKRAGPVEQLPDVSVNFGGPGDAMGDLGTPHTGAADGVAGAADVVAADGVAGDAWAATDTAAVADVPDVAFVDSSSVDVMSIDSGSPDVAAVDSGPADAGVVSCGDKSCDGSETCSSCPFDCGACPGSCGDGTCDGAKEDCKTCSADCGQCPGVCEPLTSKNCTAAQQCYPTGSGPLCGTPGSKPANSACTQATGCGKGLLCVGKLCKALCDSSGADTAYKCPSNGKCDALQYSDGKPVGYNLGTCVIYNTCNLLTDSGCAAAQSCVNVKDGKVCVSAGTKKVGEGCTLLNECAKGSMCVGNPSKCLSKCKSNGGSPSCTGIKKCLVVTTGAANTPLPDNLGVCN